MTQTNGTGTFESTLWSHPTEKELVHFRPVEDTHTTMRVTYYISKISPLKPSLQYWINEIVEKGLLQKWALDVIPKINNTALTDEKNMKLQIKHFDAIFKILILGYLVSILVLFVEIIYRKMDDRYLLSSKLKFIFYLKHAP